MYKRLNAYEIMWILVMFDLPTNTKKERKNAQQFRKRLIKDGFTMMQYSVYTRHCASRQNMDVHIKRVQNILPKHGQVSILQITDKQYSKRVNYWGKQEITDDPPPLQLEFF